MSRLYRSEEPPSDLSADGPYHLDREPVTGQQFNRYMFSGCDPEGAVDAKAALRVIHDYDASTEPIMAVQERGNANRPSNALPTLLQDMRLPRDGAPSIGTRPRGRVTCSNARIGIADDRLLQQTGGLSFRRLYQVPRTFTVAPAAPTESARQAFATASRLAATPTHPE